MQHWDRKAYRKKVAQRVCALILTVGSVAFISGKSRSKDLGKAPRLQSLTSMRVEGKELSGLRATEDSSGHYKIAMVGDRSALVHDLDVTPDLTLKRSDFIEFGQGIEDRFALCQDALGTRCQDSLNLIKSQWEGIAIDGSGRNFLLQEYSRAIVVMDPSLTSVHHVLNFDFSGSRYALKKRSKRYRRMDDTLSAEGFLLMKNGHVLIAKEKTPTVLVEFGPPGAKPLGINAETLLAEGESFEFSSATERTNLQLLSEWQIAGYGKCDISDLARDRAGSVYVLSENCGTVQKLDKLKVEDPVAVAIEKWRLPKSIRNPEGLSIDSKNRFWVASDIKDQGDNLFVVSATTLNE